MILETSFIIDFLKGENDAVSKMQSLLYENIAYEIAAPTIFELWGGLEILENSEKEREKIVSLIGGIIVYPLDEESAKIAGKIDGELVRKGQRIETEDCMIAGIAISNNKKVLTRDPHFGRIEGLKIENY